MTRQGLHDGFRHTATAFTTQVMALIAMALCTLLAHQLHELSRAQRWNLDSMLGGFISGIKYTVASALNMHDYAALLIFPAALVGCFALLGLYVWSQKDS